MKGIFPVPPALEVGICCLTQSPRTVGLDTVGLDTLDRWRPNKVASCPKMHIWRQLWYGLFRLDLL